MKKILILFLFIPFINFSQLTNFKPIDKNKLYLGACGFTTAIVTDVIFSYTSVSDNTRGYLMFGTASALGISLELLYHKQTQLWSISKYSSVIIGAGSAIALTKLKEYAMKRKKEKLML